MPLAFIEIKSLEIKSSKNLVFLVAMDEKIPRTTALQLKSFAIS